MIQTEFDSGSDWAGQRRKAPSACSGRGAGSYCAPLGPVSSRIETTGPSILAQTTEWAIDAYLPPRIQPWASTLVYSRNVRLLPAWSGSENGARR